MTKLTTNIKEAALELWRDDKGAEGLEKVLIIAAIALPLLAVLLFFSDQIRDWVSTNFSDVVGNAGDNNDPNDNPFN